MPCTLHRVLTSTNFSYICMHDTLLLFPSKSWGYFLLLSFIYFIVYLTDKLLTWTKALHMCKKRADNPNLDSQEPHRLLCPEEMKVKKNTSHSLLVVKETIQKIVVKILKLRLILHVGTVSNLAIGLCIAL